MDDDLKQLLENLKLRRIAEILARELERAEKQTPSYSAFLARLLREEYQSQEMRFLEHRIRRARLPERWSLDTYPWERQPAVSKTAMMQLAELELRRPRCQPRLHRTDRRRQDRPRICDPARRPASRTARALHPVSYTHLTLPTILLV